MSGGLNKAFRQGMRGDLLGAKDPLNYLRGALFKPGNDALGTASGTFMVNIVRDGAKVVVKPALEKRSATSHAFNAYYCANIEFKACSVTLGEDADFFFTPSLTGCILEIKGNTITHYDGQMPGFPPSQVKGVTRGGAAGTRIWDNGEFWASNVIGVRGKTGWEFYQQSFQMDQQGPLPIEQVSRI
jgi:hypothetical protein